MKSIKVAMKLTLRVPILENLRTEVSEMSSIKLGVKTKIFFTKIDVKYEANNSAMINFKQTTIISLATMG